MSRSIYSSILTVTFTFVYTPHTMTSYYTKINELPMLEDPTNASQEELISAHLRLVPSIVNKTYRRDHPLYDDLVQAGNIALMTAAKNFDPAHGVKFGSYAIPYIQMCVMNYVLDNRADIKVLTTKPLRKAFFNRRKYKTADESLDRDRMSAELNIKVSDIREMEQRIANNYISIGVSDSDEDDFFQIPDTTSDPVKILQRLELENFIDSDIKSGIEALLTDRERFIIENRYMKEEVMPLQSLAAIFGVSHTRIGQIEKAALEKLKDHLTWRFNRVKL